MVASSSGISSGASSSQSSGLVASGSEILAASTQSSGFLSSGSSISVGGTNGGSKSSSRLPDFCDSPLTLISYVFDDGLSTRQTVDYGAARTHLRIRV